MGNDLGESIRLYAQEKGISEDLVQKTIEETLLAAYKRKFGTSDNAEVRFSDDLNEVTIFALRKIVEDVYDPVSEIALEDALAYNEDAEIGDELMIEINRDDFDRVAVQSAKQKYRQTSREIHKDTLFSEFKDKVGEMIIGYFQRERNGNIFVDLGKTEGIMPKRYQSPREIYRQGDRIKALIYEVNKNPNGLQIVLSRTHTEFVKRIFELEVPEIYDKTVEIFKIVREPGYRTKLAVYSNREDVDPVGACVGLRGVRIQGIVRELEGEKIDILKYDNNPQEFIRNALSPAEVSHVVILDESKRQALAVVPEGQLSLAIGKQGLNVRLANRLVDWSIDVKTQAQFSEMDVSAASKRAVLSLFGELPDEEEISRISELPDIPKALVARLLEHGTEYIEDLVAMNDEELSAIPNLGPDDVATLKQIIAENVEIIDEDDEENEIGDDETEESDSAQADVTDESETSDETAETDDAVDGTDETAAEADSEFVETESSDDETSPGDTGDEETASTSSDAEIVEQSAGPEPEVLAPELDDEEEIEVEEEEEITLIAELPGITERVVGILKEAGIEDILDLLDMPENRLRELQGIGEEDVAAIQQIISDNVEIIEEDEDNTDAE